MAESKAFTYEKFPILPDNYGNYTGQTFSLAGIVGNHTGNSNIPCGTILFTKKFGEDYVKIINYANESVAELKVWRDFPCNSKSFERKAFVCQSIYVNNSWLLMVGVSDNSLYCILGSPFETTSDAQSRRHYRKIILRLSSGLAVVYCPFLIYFGLKFIKRQSDVSSRVIPLITVRHFD